MQLHPDVVIGVGHRTGEGGLVAAAHPVQGRGGLGVVTARIVDARGVLIGALMVCNVGEPLAAATLMVDLEPLLSSVSVPEEAEIV